MDIQASQTPERAKETYEQQQRALIDANRALVRAARERLAAVGREHQQARSAERQSEQSRRDEIRLSDAARTASQPSPDEREARVRALAEAHKMERLHTPERIERAAERLLEG